MRGQDCRQAKALASCALPELPMRQLIKRTRGSQIDFTSNTGQMFNMYKKQFEMAAATRFRRAVESSSAVPLQPFLLVKPPAPALEDFVDTSADLLFWEYEERMKFLQRELAEEAIPSGRRGSKKEAGRAEELPYSRRGSCQKGSARAFQRTVNGILDEDEKLPSMYAFARCPVSSPVSRRGSKQTIVGAGEVILSSRRASKESAGTASVVLESRHIPKAAADAAEAHQRLPSDLGFWFPMSRRTQVLLADPISLWPEVSREIISTTREKPVFRP